MRLARRRRRAGQHGPQPAAVAVAATMSIRRRRLWEALADARPGQALPQREPTSSPPRRRASRRMRACSRARPRPVRAGHRRRRADPLVHSRSRPAPRRPSPHRPSLDTTAAGDAFVARLLHRLVERGVGRAGIAAAFADTPLLADAAASCRRGRRAGHHPPWRVRRDAAARRRRHAAASPRHEPDPPCPCPTSAGVDVPARAHRRHDGVLSSARDRSGTAASSTISATTAASTTPRTGTWSAARASSSTTRWRHASSRDRPVTAAYRDAAAHGLRYLRDVASRSRAAAAMRGRCATASPEDRTNHCYGVAFVLLAYSTALKAGIDEAAPWMDETWELLEAHASGTPEPACIATRPTPTGDFSDYRGQNANMHMCEAMLAAFEASGEARYLDRALTARRPHDAAPGGARRWPGLGALRPRLERRLGLPPRRSQAPVPPVGLPARPPDRMDQAAADPRRPPARARRRPTGCCRPRAHLFDTAVAHAWDERPRRPVYGFAPDAGHPVCDDDKYFWVQAEVDRRGRAAGAGHRRRALLGLVRPAVGLRVATTSSTTSTAPGTASSIATTASTATRRARPARPTTTPWARATTCCSCCAARALGDTHELRSPSWPSCALALLARRAPPRSLPQGNRRDGRHRRRHRAAAAGRKRCRRSERAARQGRVPARLERLPRSTPGATTRSSRSSNAAHDWYGQSLLMTPVDALDTMIADGPGRRGRRCARADRHAAVVRPRPRRQAFRDRDPPARRPAVGLPAHRRRAPAEARRGPRHAPAAGVRFADRPALRLRQPAHRQGRTATTAIRPRPARCCSSTAR